MSLLSQSNRKRLFTIVLGMERYNTDLFLSIKKQFETLCPEFTLNVFHDTELIENRARFEQVISESDLVFSALMVIDESAEILVDSIKKYSPPIVFGFESLPSVMKQNKVGSYSFSEKSEIPKPVKRIAQLIGGGKEEDALYGFVQLQKMTNRIMKFMPESFGGEKFHDARVWMTVGTYWTNNGEENIINMLLYTANQLFGKKIKYDSPKEFQSYGLYHPEHYASEKSFFHDIKSYTKWEKKSGRLDEKKPKVGLLFSRKHILTGQTYPNEVIKGFEAAGFRVFACYALGIELHIVARTWFRELKVDSIVNLFGFPLVGGPAGSTKAGLANPSAQEILSEINSPYIVAQPLFVQSEESWEKHGVNPIQSMIMFSLPEMDGAVSPVVLGALENEKITIRKTRLNRLIAQLSKFISLKKKSNHEKKIGIVLYNYPPNQGKIGTAALLQVPNSLLNIVKSLQREGYDTGDFLERYEQNPESFLEDLNASLQSDRIAQQLKAEESPILASLKNYREWISEKDESRIEARWGATPGDLSLYGKDQFILGGFVFGNLYIGPEPQLFIQGDPMRLLFDKENTPHHQYIMFYKWLDRHFKADAVIHFGMHGTSEWMPGLQLGLSDNCWSDSLLGAMPQFYIYPMNNPSEANIAKRRGYSTIISHAIPPYARAGLYKEFQALKDLIDDYRIGRDSEELRRAISIKVSLLGIELDINPLLKESDYNRYISDVMAYLKQMEARLICADLHTFGENPNAETMTELITESLKNQHELGLLHLAAKANGIDDIHHIFIKAKEGDERAIAKKSEIEAFCKSLVENLIVK
ncbi:MAG: cobaltochelatase subunit CobN [Chloroherpetonaceae bacterium]|nr:cobaltochelatase subunit CobN [Chloroherpetonaceae bacterium]